MIDPIDVTVDDSFFNGLIGSGLSEITVEAENDIMVSGFFDISNSWLLPPNEDGTPGIGTLSFHAGNNLRFDFPFNADGMSMTISFDVVIDGEDFEGTVVAGDFGSFDVEGSRLSTPN